MSWLKKDSVLIPVDFSELSYEAIAPAQEFVEDMASIHIIHVLSPLHPADPVALWDTLSDDDRKQKVKTFLTEKLDELGYKGTGIEVTVGDPAGQIVDYAKEVEADLIVMPSHGRKGARRFLLGSVSERVMRISPCPVLILK